MSFFNHFMYFSTVFFFSVILSCVRLSHFIKEPAAAAAIMLSPVRQSHGGSFNNG